MIKGENTSDTGRLLSLDVLRGLAILLMVLSGSIAFGGLLPAWMYHAQVPPPAHTFDPDIAGITWVDLVFPLFLFSMGAAFPLALRKKIGNSNLLPILLQVIKRYILLVFFALFIYHARAWVMSSTAGLIQNLLSIGCFILLFMMFVKLDNQQFKFSLIQKTLGFALAISFLSLYPFEGKGFDFYKSDIIIIVLANMALFGSLIWIFTHDKPWLRVAILPLVMAIFFSGKVTESWTSTVFNWSPLSWAYTFYYLKYLFIIIPGTFAGDWLLQAKPYKTFIKPSGHTLIIALLCLLLVVLNVVFLYSRELVLNVILTLLLAILIVYQSRKSGIPKIYQNFVYLGVFLLFLGLCFEPYEGGIKKDPSTYSYYFVCSGIAFLILFSFLILEAGEYLKKSFSFIAQIGQNPMIAYTAGNLFLLPLLKITDLESTLNLLNQNPWGGFLRGFIFTMIIGLITVFFTNKRIFWKT